MMLKFGQLRRQFIPDTSEFVFPKLLTDEANQHRAQRGARDIPSWRSHSSCAHGGDCPLWAMVREGPDAQRPHKRP